MPCVDDMNARRASLFKCALLFLDESMFGWRPKTSQLGGLPNYTYEPRNLVPLDTMFNNGVYCIREILMFQDVVMSPECQKRKKYYGDM